MRADEPFIRSRTSDVTLPDGSAITVRPIAADDKAGLADGVASLSPRSRYLRFFNDVERLSDRDLRYLTEIDYVDHFAWVATTAGTSEPSGVGVARYIRLGADDPVAEAAVAVIDPWQGRGVGGVLLSLLAQSAVDNGIRTFRTYVLAENSDLVERLRRERVETRRDGDMYEVDVALPLERPAASARRVLEHVARLDATS